MTKDVKLIRVFVSSPGDTEAERQLIRRIIQEQNTLWGDVSGILFEFVGWETHTHPDVGKDPQDVINQQIVDFDIYVGVIASRLGTPTPRSESGTVEEFELAYKKRSESQDPVSIMLYFKDLGLETANGEELYRIEQFRQRASEQGAYYSVYRDLAQLEALLRVHFVRLLQERIPFVPSQARSITFLEVISALVSLVRGLSMLRKARRTLRTISKAMGEIETASSKRFEELGKRPLDEPDLPSELRTRVADMLANDLDRYSASIRGATFPFGDALVTSMLLFIDAYTVLHLANHQGFGIQRMRITMDRLIEVLTWVKEHIEGVNSAIVRLAEVTLSLRKAKNGASAATQFLIRELDRGANLAEQLRAVLQE